MLNGGMGQQQRALPEIVQHKRRQDEGEPGESDGLFSEIAHVSVERLAPGHDENSGETPDTPLEVVRGAASVGSPYR